MKFATIALIAVAATTVEASKCGKVTTTHFTDKTCKTADAKKEATTLDLTGKDVCHEVKKGSKTYMQAVCDGKGFAINVWGADATCGTKKGLKGDALKPKSSTKLAWGTSCTGAGKLFTSVKGAESLKMALTGAALALVASQF
jgi:hypothetical protein